MFANGKVWRIGLKTPYEDTPVSAIDMTALTHINQVGSQVLSTGALYDISLYTTELVSTAHAAGVKVLLNITDSGGDRGGGTPNFNAGVTNNLSTLVANIVAAVNAGGYDGVDVDWELSTDYTKLLTFLTALRQDLGVKILTCDCLTNDYSNMTSAIAFLCDRVNVMTYDISGTWDPYTWFHAAENDDDSGSGAHVGSMENTRQRFLAAGVPANKLCLALPFFGQKSVGGSLSTNAPRLSYGTSPTFSEITYTSLVSTYSAQMASATRDSVARMPWFPISDPGWINYDDPTSVAHKVAYIRANGLGGWIIWSLDKDYIAAGGTQATKHPLLAATK